MRATLYKILYKLQPLLQAFYSNRLKVLAYHKVPDRKVFDQQVHYLSLNYNILSVEDLRLYFQGKKSFPDNPLLLTFDDGDISVFENGLPVLQKYKVPSCLFIITSLINTNNDVWIKNVEAGEMAKGKSYWEARKIVNHLKELKNGERLQEMDIYSNISKKQLNTKQLLILQENGMFIANHSHTHPMFDKCSEEEIQQEILNSKEIFTSLQLNGFPVFAYPNGNVDDLSQKMLKKAGMEMIFLFDHKINKLNPDPYHISRIRVDADNEFTEFKTKVTGVHPFIFSLKKRFFN